MQSLLISPSKLVSAEGFSSFDPTIHQACRLTVDLSAPSTLSFERLLKQAYEVAQSGAKILWQLDFAFSNRLSDFRFEGIYNTHFEAIRVFNSAIGETFKANTLGYILYEGYLDVYRAFSWSDIDFIEFKEWLFDLYQTPGRLFESSGSISGMGDFSSFDELSKEMFDVTPFGRHLKNLFSMNILLAYLHRLLAALAEDSHAFIDLHIPKEFHKGFVHQLLSKERFSHIELFHPLEDPEKEYKIGVCLPNDPFCFPSMLQMFKKTLDDLCEKKLSFKVIPEFMMTSSWEGLDYIVYSRKGLSPQGKRILQGFCAAGGSALYTDEPVETGSDQESLIKYLSEC